MPDDFCLILETSTRRGSAALANASTGELLDERVFESDRNHNALMFGPLAELLADGAAPHITRVLVGAGPGSYSGTRVGIAVAQGIAIARSCPAVAIPSLIAVADPPAAALAIGDARRGHWWWARIAGRILDSEVLEMGDFQAFETTLAAALAEGREVFSFENPKAFGLPAKIRNQIRQKLPHASALWHAWRTASPDQRDAWAAAPPQPCYLKPPHISAPKRPWLQAQPAPGG